MGHDGFRGYFVILNLSKQFLIRICQGFDNIIPGGGDNHARSMFTYFKNVVQDMRFLDPSLFFFLQAISIFVNASGDKRFCATSNNSLSSK